MLIQVYTIDTIKEMYIDNKISQLITDGLLLWVHRQNKFVEFMLINITSYNLECHEAIMTQVSCKYYKLPNEQSKKSCRNSSKILNI